jgi:HlyD family secretion protein
VYIAILLFITAALASLPFITVEVSTQARGIIRGEFDNNRLQTVVSGEVTDVRIAENQVVRQGDTLLVLNAENIDVQINRAQERIAEYSAFVRDISALLAENFSALRTPKYLFEGNLFRSSDNEHQTRIAFLRNELEVSQRLQQRDVIAQSDYLRERNNYDNAVRSHDNLREQFRNRWQAERTSYEQNIRSLQADILRLTDEKTRYVLLAPVSGTIIQFSGIRQGNFIAPGQIVAEISANENLLVETFVSPADIGFISENQKVRFQLDAFNFHQWGMAEGTVLEISPDIITIGDQPVFRVRSSLDTKYLQLRNGYRGNLTKGMTLTGRFHLTERTLWQLLFDRVDNWLNPVQN